MDPERVAGQVEEDEHARDHQKGARDPELRLLPPREETPAARLLVVVTAGDVSSGARGLGDQADGGRLMSRAFRVSLSGGESRKHVVPGFRVGLQGLPAAGVATDLDPDGGIHNDDGDEGYNDGDDGV